MSESKGGTPWLDEEECQGGIAPPPTLTATVIEGAEVVRTAAVSYATPILHQVYIQGAPGSHSNRATSPDLNRNFPISLSCVSSSTLQPPNDLLAKGVSAEDSADGNPPRSSSVPLWVISSSLLSSNSVVLRPANHMASANLASASIASGSIASASLSPASLSSLILTPSSASPCSSSTPPIISLPYASVNGGRSDDELTSLSWLQNSNLLMGTALSPIKHPQSSSKFTLQQQQQQQQEESASASASTSAFASASASASGSILPASVERKRTPKTISLTHPSRNEGVTLLPATASSPTSVKPPEGEEGESDHPRRSSSRKFLLENSKVDLESEDLRGTDSPTTSECAEEGSDPSAGVPEEGKTSQQKTQQQQSQLPIPYNPKIHVKAKPPFSFSCLIFMAIEESPTKALPVKDIYSWILEHYPYYRTAPTGWKNSVRHNLSLNKCFSKVEKAPNLGKGSLWMVDPTFRPNLLQAMSKSNLTPQSGGMDSKSCILTSKTVINTKYLYGLTSKTPDRVVPMGDFVVQNEVEVRPSNTTTHPHQAAPRRYEELQEGQEPDHAPAILHKNPASNQGLFPLKNYNPNSPPLYNPSPPQPSYHAHSSFGNGVVYPEEEEITCRGGGYYGNTISNHHGNDSSKLLGNASNHYSNAFSNHHSNASSNHHSNASNHPSNASLNHHSNDSSNPHSNASNHHSNDSSNHHSNASNHHGNASSNHHSNAFSFNCVYSPNPELFPRLAKRLRMEAFTSSLSQGTQPDLEPEQEEHYPEQEEHYPEQPHHFDSSTIGVQSEDVDAAAAMLVLKHGPRVLTPYHESFPNMRASSEHVDGIVVNSSRKRNHKSSESSSDSGLMVISSSPSLDHAYVSRGNRADHAYCPQNGSAHKRGTPTTTLTRTKEVTTTSPASSLDEAFFDDSFEGETVGDNSVTASLRGRPFEEADALLNLAAVATSLASGQMLVAMEDQGITNDLTPRSSSESVLVPMETHHHPTLVDASSSESPSSSKRLKLLSSRSKRNSRSSSNSSNEQSIHSPKPPLKQLSGSSGSYKQSKRKSSSGDSNLPSTKKGISRSSSTFPTKLMRASHNNNNNNVLNRNKLLKVRKVLRARKTRR